ncbi:hypothetical protein GCM10009731_04920 [Streptomyces globosus]
MIAEDQACQSLAGESGTVGVVRGRFSHPHSLTGCVRIEYAISPLDSSPLDGLDVVSFGESAVADEGCGDADEGEEVLGLAFVAAVEASVAGQP